MKTGKYLDQPTFQTPSIKYGSLTFIKKTCPHEIYKFIEDNCPIVGQHKNIVVDIKIHHLQTGDCPTNKIWHIDSVAHPLDPRKEELNHLIVFGQCLTLFLKEDRQIDIPEQRFNNFNRFIEPHNVDHIQSNRFITYGRVPHCGAVCSVPETRLLIRVSETDIVRPFNRIL